MQNTHVIRGRYPRAVGYRSFRLQFSVIRTGRRIFGSRSSCFRRQSAYAARRQRVTAIALPLALFTQLVLSGQIAAVAVELLENDFFVFIKRLARVYLFELREQLAHR